MNTPLRHETVMEILRGSQFVFLRHGQISPNDGKRPEHLRFLVAEGIKQIQTLRLLFQETQFDVVYSSPHLADTSTLQRLGYHEPIVFGSLGSEKSPNNPITSVLSELGYVPLNEGYFQHKKTDEMKIFAQNALQHILQIILDKDLKGPAVMIVGHAVTLEFLLWALNSYIGEHLGFAQVQRMALETNLSEGSCLHLKIDANSNGHCELLPKPEPQQAELHHELAHA